MISDILNKESCYDLKKEVKKGDLLISRESDFNIKTGRVYIAEKNQGEGTFYDCVFIKNDKGIVDAYSTEYFSFYEGELVSSY